MRCPARQVMISKLREVLLTQYIGAFLIALLAWQALIETITLVVRSGYWMYYSHRSSSLADYSQFRWDNLVVSAVHVVLYLAVAYGLGKWLYSPKIPPVNSNIDEGSYSDAPEES